VTTNQSVKIIKTLASQKHKEAALRFYGRDELRDLLVGSGYIVTNNFSKEQLVQMILQTNPVIQVGAVT